jgi:hypothetical protein
MRKVFDLSPVWKTAPPGALRKANKLCSLLHTVAVDGWKANISHLLERLSIQIWKMSLRDFNGVCRSIFARIAKASRETDFRSSPDPLQRFGTLSNNPICNPNSVYRNPMRRHGSQGYRFCISHAPKQLGLQRVLLNERALRTDLKRVKKRLLQWFTPHGLESVRDLISKLTMR